MGWCFQGPHGAGARWAKVGSNAGYNSWCHGSGDCTASEGINDTTVGTLFWPIEYSKVPPDEKDLLIAELWEQGSAGMVELSQSRLRAFFEDDADRRALLERFAMFDPAPRAEEDRDWIAFSRENWHPMAAGARF